MWNDGIVTTDSGDMLARPGMTLDDFQASAISHGGIIEPMGPGYEKAHEMRPFIIDGHECRAALYFGDRSLSLLTLQLSNTEAARLFGTNAGGDAELDFLFSWVRQQSGRRSPAKFSWGKIVAARDTRGASFCFIDFNYE